MDFNQKGIYSNATLQGEGGAHGDRGQTAMTRIGVLGFGEAGSALPWLAAVLLAAAALWLALRFFRRFSGHFEDFL